MRADKTIQQPLSRSDLVRQRRQDRSSKRITQTREAVNRASNTPAVVVRGSTLNAARPIHQTSRSRVKRQFYYSIGASGAELRLPALPMISLGWKGMSAIIAVFSALILFTLAFSPQFQVSDIQVEFHAPAGFHRLAGKIAEVEKDHGTSGTRFYYLAVAPKFFAEVTRQLG